MSDEETEVVYFELPDERHEEFVSKLLALLEETRDLGPAAHTAMMGQMIGQVCASNPNWPLEAAGRTMLMNIHHGYSNAIHHFMEQSAGGKAN